MLSHQGHEDTLSGVGCTVAKCKYNNKNNMCTADSIVVNTQQNCATETDTFCDTFVSEG